MNKIYFTGSITGGREKENDYIKIVDFLKQENICLTEHVAYPDLLKKDYDLDASYIYKRDRSWLNECDIFIADISVPSTGVGYEIAYSESIGKKIICIYDSNMKKPTKMILGNENLIFIEYQNIEEVISKLKNII